MADDQFLSTTIDAYLLSLANGVRAAQEQLNLLPPEDALGRPQATYYLPRLDFELRVAFEISRTSEGPFDNVGRVPGAAARVAVATLLLRPVQPQDTTVSNFKAEAISTLRGSFVAVPPNQGRPPLVLASAVRRVDARTAEITASLRTAAGEPLPGAEVHFNLDLETTRAVGAPDGISPQSFEFQPGTRLLQGVVPTAADGTAASTLEIDPAEPPGLRVAVAVDAVDRSESLLIGAEVAP